MRFILNFNHACCLNCEWCYVPFSGKNPSEAIIISIISRCVEAGYKVVTIGGGDPYQYLWINNVLKFSKDKGLFVHIDTNSVSLDESKKNMNYLDKYVDLIGLPVDGATADIHDMMRSKNGNFDLVIKKIKWLSFMEKRLKINTFISSMNIYNLDNISEYICKIQPKIWSIYQYWPLNNNKIIENKHKLEDEVFLASIDKIYYKLKEQDIIIESTDRKVRHNTYPIITHDGNVSVHFQENNTFLEIGSIFLDSTIDILETLCYQDRYDAKLRYI